MTEVVVRKAAESELPQLARVWYDAWQDAHAAILPPELAALRTLQSFEGRLCAALDDVRAVGPIGAPVGFCLIKDDELYQIFIAAEARGGGAAVALIDDAEARLAARGVKVAWLACAIGNDRAARFYEKRGWRRAGIVTNILTDVPGKPFPLDIWRYEKALS